MIHLKRITKLDVLSDSWAEHEICSCKRCCGNWSWQSELFSLLLVLVFVFDNYGSFDGQILISRIIRWFAGTNFTCCFRLTFSRFIIEHFWKAKKLWEGYAISVNCEVQLAIWFRKQKKITKLFILQSWFVWSSSKGLFMCFFFFFPFSFYWQ